MLLAWLGTGLQSSCFVGVSVPLVDGLFALGASGEDMSNDVALPLSSGIRRELVLLSAPAPFMCSNVAVGYLPSMFASDASLAKGAYVSAAVDEARCEELWLDSEKRGCHVTLDNGFREILKHVGEDFEEEVPKPPPVRPKSISLALLSILLRFVV